MFQNRPLNFLFLVTFILLYGCGKPELPSYHEMTKLIKDSLKSSICFYPFPKKIFVGGDGVFNIETEMARKISKLYEDGSDKGYWTIEETQEGTGEFFFSVEKQNRYYKLSPSPKYAELFEVRDSDMENYYLKLRTIKIDTVINIFPYKVENNQAIEIIVFYSQLPYPTSLYDFISPTQCFDSYGDGTDYTYVIVSKKAGIWEILHKSFMTRAGYEQLAKMK
jgi:hypothetical protein